MTKTQKYNAISIAKYLLSLDKERKYFNNKKMTNGTTMATVIRGNFRLNQILYLLQIIYYLENKQPLFEDKLYAWEHGVIVYSVYTHFWSLYLNLNSKEIIENQKIKEFITKCFEYLKNLPDRVLQEFSYNDPAWSSTWAKSSQPEINFTEKENLKTYRELRFIREWSRI